jgi:hypothetical protein
MVRWLAGIAAILLFIVAAVLALQGDSNEFGLPPAPQPRLAVGLPGQLSPITEAPVADAKSKEVKRFDRSDKNEDGRITLAELVEPRRKAFAKLDTNSDGRLSFEEWAVKSIDKFEGADADRNQALNRAEFATTAPKPRPKKPDCACT